MHFVESLVVRIKLLQANQFMKKRIEKEIERRKKQKKKEIMTPTVQIKDNYMFEIQEDCWDGYEKKGKEDYVW